MTQKGIMAALIILLMSVLLISPSTANAQTAAVISNYTIESKDGGDVTDKPLMTGAIYTISFEVSLASTLQGTSLSLYTPLEKVEDVYWSLVNNYTGVNTDTWQPGQNTIQFDAIKGIAEFTVTGKIPSTYTTEKLSNEDTLHFIKPISLVVLKLSASGESLNEITSEVKDETIAAYQTELNDKKSLLQTSGADPTYNALAQEIIDLAEELSGKGYIDAAISLLEKLPGTATDLPSMDEFNTAVAEKTALIESTDIDPTYADLANKIISLAEDLSNNGYVNNAMELINTLPDDATAFPKPTEKQSIILYLIIILVLALILIVCLMLLIKNKSSGSFIKQQVEEEAGKLDVLLVKISKIDRQLGHDIEQVKEQLEQISGR